MEIIFGDENEPNDTPLIEVMINYSENPFAKLQREL